MARRRRKSKSGKWVGRVLTAVLALPALYLTAALIGSLIPVNRGWTEPAEGTTIYIADNGIHTDIIMPVEAQGLDWRRLVPQSDTAAAPPNAQWIAFGVGERAVYLNTPRWQDIRGADRRPGSHARGTDRSRRVGRNPGLRPSTAAAPAGRVSTAVGSRTSQLPGLATAANSAQGLWPRRCLLRGRGSSQCDQYLQPVDCGPPRLAGVRTSLWSPFDNGLTWRYRRTND